MKVGFPHFTQSSKMLIPLDCDKSHGYIEIPVATTVKMIENDTHKNTIS